MASNGNAKERRVLVKDLEGRISELEQKIRDLSEQVPRLDQRLQRVADLVALAQAERV